MAGTVVAAIGAVAARDPSRTAVIDRGERRSYAALDLALRRAAAWLHLQGIAPGATVGLTLRAEWPHLVASLALFHLGCRQVTLSSRDAPAMRAALAARLGVSAVIADGVADAMPGALLLPLPDIAVIAADAALDAHVPRAVGGGGTLVITSSGTTGRPKLIAVAEPLLALQGRLTAPLGVVRLRTVGNEFSTAKRLQLHTLSAGGTDLLANNLDGTGLPEFCAAFGVQRLNIATLRAEALLAEAARPGATRWPAATAITLAGGPVPAALRQRLMAELTPEVHVLYATSETGPVSIAGPADHGLDPATVGRPFAGVAIEVVDDAGRPLPPGERGMVRIRSPAAVAGYLDDPEATGRAFRDGWFLPGDVGSMLPGGALSLAGRGDDMMNLGTIKIFPAEIEAAAEGFAGVLDCAAFPMRAAGLGDIPMLAVVGAEGFDAAALLAHCRARLSLRAPRKVIVLPALPRNAAGKVLRRDLPGLAAQQPGPRDGG
ncbi:long-chain fatty acid--CoA ligase [Roseomonas sp. CAU 1739]